MKMLCIAAACLYSSFLLLLPAEVQAHRVNVFAWVEGDTVHTHSTANRGKPIRNGQIKVYGSEGTVLLEGTTDLEGKFSFPRPGSGALKIELLAGPGHKGSWTLEGSSAEKEAIDAQTPPPEPQPDAQPIPTSEVHPPCLTKAEIAEIVDHAVAQRVAPLQEMIAANGSRGPGIREILGGLGYILGLVGLGAYLHYRQKSAAPNSPSGRKEKN